MPPRTLGVGLISVGWMGKAHSRAYSALAQVYPDLGAHIKLVHAADTTESARTYATNVLGYERASADYRSVLEDPDVDVVSICSPNFLHAQMGVAAAQAGKPFWIEKPVGRDLEDTSAVQAAAAAAGVVTTIGFNYRNPPAVQYAKQLIDTGALGRITNIRGRYFGGFSSNPEDPLTWRFVRELAGSGVLGDLMGHLVDQVHYLVGPIGSVVATTGTYLTTRPSLDTAAEERLPVENEDYATMLVRFDDSAVAAGALGSLEASRIAVGPRSDYGFEIFGTEGSVRWRFEQMNELELALTHSGPHVGYTRIFADHHFPEFARFQPSSGTGMGYDDLKTIEASRFIGAVLGGEPLSANINDAVASAQVLAAAETSASTGKWVETPVIAGATANTASTTAED